MPHTPGKWTAEHRPSKSPEDCGAVVVDEAGNELFDSYNRHYKRSLSEQPDSSGRWFDTAGYADLELAAQAPDLLAQTQRDAAVIESLKQERDLFSANFDAVFRNAQCLQERAKVDAEEIAELVSGRTRDAAVIAELVAAASVQCHCGSNAAHEAAQAVIAKYAAESRAEAEVKPQGQWQPIATAPSQKIVITVALVDAETGNWNMRSSYLGRREGGDYWDGWPTYCQPTHWMPMPEPPADIAADSKAARDKYNEAQRLKREAAGPEVTK